MNFQGGLQYLPVFVKETLGGCLQCIAPTCWHKLIAHFIKFILEMNSISRQNLIYFCIFVNPSLVSSRQYAHQSLMRYQWNFYKLQMFLVNLVSEPKITTEHSVHTEINIRSKNINQSTKFKYKVKVKKIYLCQIYFLNIS